MRTQTITSGLAYTYKQYGFTHVLVEETAGEKKITKGFRNYREISRFKERWYQFDCEIITVNKAIKLGY